jgi:hypothetical protein
LSKTRPCQKNEECTGVCKPVPPVQSVNVQFYYLENKGLSHFSN